MERKMTACVYQKGEKLNDRFLERKKDNGENGGEDIHGAKVDLDGIDFMQCGPEDA